MLGKKVDWLALSALIATALYLYFLNAWHSIPLAGALALVCSALLNMVAARRPVRHRRSAAQAEAEILRLACLPEAEADAALDALIRRKYPGERFELVCLQKYPGGALSAGDVFGVWRERRGGAPVVIAATCAADPHAFAYARALADPPVALVDKQALKRILRDAPSQPLDKSVPPLRGRFRLVLSRALAQRANPRRIVLGFALLGMYLALGNPLYLVAAMGLLFLNGVFMIQGRRSSRLFD